MRNITPIGSLTITDGVASGFSTSNYILLPQIFDVSGGQDWEMVFKFTTGDNVTDQSVIASGLTNPYFNWCIQDGKTQNNVGDGTNWLVSSGSNYGSTEISPNTTYWIKVNFNGVYVRLYLSTNGSTYNLDWSFTTSKSIPVCNVVLGQGRTLSSTNVPTSIDLDESYIKIDDKVWWNGKNRNIYSIKAQIQQAEGFMCYKQEGYDDEYLYVKLPIKPEGRNSYTGILHGDRYEKLTLEELQESFSDPDEPNYSEYEYDYVTKLYPDYKIQGTDDWVYIPSLEDSYITGYTPKIGNYTLRKFYNRIDYTCGVASTSSGSFFAYAKTPFKVGDYVYFVGDGSTEATSESDLTQSTSVYITECDDDSFVTYGMIFNGEALTIGFSAYKNGNLTTPVKTFYLLYRR